MSPPLRRFVALALGLAGVASSVESRADEREECAAAYEHTQRQQQKSELLASLDSAERCARSTCPTVLKDECSRWVSELKPKLPRIVVHVRASDGCTGGNAKIDVTGASRRESEDTIVVDPGTHDVKVTDPSTGKTRTQSVKVGTGERRDIDVAFSPESAVCGTTAPLLGTVPKVTLVLAGVGGGLLVLGGALGVVGAIKRSDLDDCKPTCSDDRIDAVRPFLVAGDVVAGAGLLTLGAAAVSYFVLKTHARGAALVLPPGPGSRPTLWLGGSGVVGTF